jgi:hypothetical protein
MRNQLLYAIAFCGLLTTTHMIMTMDLSLSETPKNSPKSTPRSSRSRSQSHSPRTQEISKDSIPKLYFTNNPNTPADYDYINSIPTKNNSQSKITFKNKDGKQKTVIAEFTENYNQENFIVIEEKIGDTIIKSTINMNPDQSQKTIELDDTKNSTKLNVAIIGLKLNKPNEEHLKKEFQKRAQQNKKVIIAMKRIIGISAFTGIIIAILYKYDQLPQTFINALNKILPKNYAL